MSNSGTVAAGSQATAAQYNNLRLDAIDIATGHVHSGATDDGNPMLLSAFGDGSQGGTVTITGGTTTLAQDTYYNNLTITSTGILVVGSGRLFVRGVLNIQAGGLIHNRGAAASNSPAATTSAGAAAALPGINGGGGQWDGVASHIPDMLPLTGMRNNNTGVGQPGRGCTGGTGGNGGAAAAGTAGAACSSIVALDNWHMSPTAGYNNGVAGAVGGISGGGQAGGAGGAATNSPAVPSGQPTILNKCRMWPDCMYAFRAEPWIAQYTNIGNPAPGGGGGGGGGGAASSTGGGGGGGGSAGGCGGLLLVVCNILTGSGTLSAAGGAGGNGGNGAPGTGTNAGGGAGGGGGNGGNGGNIILVFREMGAWSGTITVAGGAHGTGGTGGAKTGTGVVGGNGANGGDGIAGIIFQNQV